MLSVADRKYLLDPSSYTRQSAYNRRSKIVERVANTIYDFWLLSVCLEEREVREIADAISFDGPGHPISQQEFDLLSGPSPVPGENNILGSPGGYHRGVVTLISLLYRIYGDDEAGFEKLLEEGINGGIEKERGGLWSVDVDLEVERVEGMRLDDVIERLEAGEHHELSDLDREIVLSRLIEEDALDLDALRRSFEKDERLREQLEDSEEEKYVKRADGEFVKLAELDKELHELDEDRFEQRNESDEE